MGTTLANLHILDGENKNLLNSTAILAIYLLVMGVVYHLISFLGYTFIPINELIFLVISVAITVLLTVVTLKRRKESTKFSTVLSALTPLIAIYFVITKGFATDLDMKIYTAIAFVTLICSMVNFFSGKQTKKVKIGCGIAYIIAMLPIIFALLLFTFFAHFDLFVPHIEVIKVEMSPNNIHLAEVIESSDGAMGGSTQVHVKHLIRKPTNLLFGELVKEPTQVYFGRWGEFETMTLHWETDKILYINETRYEIRCILC